MTEHKYIIKSWGGVEVEVYPKLFLYAVKDAITGKNMTIPGIQLYYMDDGFLEPYQTLTVSFGEFIGMKNCAYIDVNNCSPFAKQLLDAFGAAKDTGLTKRSGYCEYPLYVFDEQFLREIGGVSYDRYSDQFDAYMKMFEEE